MVRARVRKQGNARKASPIYGGMLACQDYAASRVTRDRVTGCAVDETPFTRGLPTVAELPALRGVYRVSHETVTITGA